MKNISKTGCMALLLCISFWGNAQVVKRLGNHIKYKTEQKAKEKIDRAIDNATDGSKNSSARNDDNKSPGNKKADNAKSTNGQNEQNEFSTYAKFDFVPGEKIVLLQDFINVPIGDFPDGWNTNSSGDIQTIEGRPGHWLSISKPGIFWPEFIKSLPQDFTLEFWLCCNKEFSGAPFSVILAELGNPAEDFTNFYRNVPRGTNAVLCSLHPSSGDGSGKVGECSYRLLKSGDGNMANEAKTIQFTKLRNFVKVSLWRTKSRFRVYLNEEKVWDLPRAFSDDADYNTLLFRFENASVNARYLFTNIRLAVGAPDIRSKLLTEGKFATSGILFGVNSAEVKAESNGVLKEVAAVLNEAPELRLQIVGHTDADGDGDSNLELSRRRAEAIKNKLIEDFSITAARLEIDGKGESLPVDKNTTPEGRANNRRVEFIKQ